MLALASRKTPAEFAADAAAVQPYKVEIAKLASGLRKSEKEVLDEKNPGMTDVQLVQLNKESQTLAEKNLDADNIWAPTEEQQIDALIKAKKFLMSKYQLPTPLTKKLPKLPE